MSEENDRRHNPPDRRSQFLEKLSYLLVTFSSLGAVIVLLDPVITITLESGTLIHIGGEGFADQLKGGVVLLMIVGGFTGLVSFWFPGSATGQKSAEVVGRIAEQSAPVAAAAVAAAVPVIPPTGTKVDAAGDVTVTKKDT